MVALLAVDVALDGVEGTPLSCEAEAEEVIPKEGEMWIEAQSKVDCPECGVLNQAITGGCKKDVKLACGKIDQLAG